MIREEKRWDKERRGENKRRRGRRKKGGSKLVAEVDDA